MAVPVGNMATDVSSLTELISQFLILNGDRSIHGALSRERAAVLLLIL